MNPRIPQTDSIQELADFWQTHDLTDFETQLEVVESPFSGAATTIKLQLQPQEVAAVEQVARSRGLDAEALIREWVLEKVQAE